MSREPIRLTRRGRIVVVAFAALAVLGLGVGGRAAFAGGPSSARESVVVEPGDTLWDIAVAAEPRKDPRLVVARIVDLNHLSGVVVEPGQRLVLP
ncbi:LysM peptidoglycan-binding domain-containing protein [Actinocorallia longicatena]|uniref:LysM domain-containing protein n=1 Tax=Actinocorallia longicatena TaxID=111803 RepID=A0ABP6QH03_9ACTN